MEWIARIGLWMTSAGTMGITAGLDNASAHTIMVLYGGLVLGIGLYLTIEGMRK